MWQSCKQFYEMKCFLPFLCQFAILFSTSDMEKVADCISSLSVHLCCCFLLNRKVKYFNMKGTFSDPHTIRGLTKAGKEVSCSADPQYCSLKHFRSSCVGFQTNWRLDCILEIALLIIALVREICVFHLEKIFMNLTVAC